MSFTIKIGKTGDNAFKVNKTYTELSPQAGVTIHPTSTIDQIRPEFIIDYNSAYLTANYVEAAFLGRKYFCTVKVDTGTRMILTCEVDYLSSFDLSECPVTVVRNGGLGAPTKIQDTKFPVLPSTETVQQVAIAHEAFTPYGERCYVLQCIGGAVSNGSE